MDVCIESAPLPSPLPRILRIVEPLHMLSALSWRVISLRERDRERVYRAKMPPLTASLIYSSYLRKDTPSQAASSPVRLE